ncbi:hypothetical protein GA0074696_2050 [Micromonospora purpureochromogenes]|uniref:Uncharacterized protein n=1 Tax=Micromonospora purpureochromogenes TaxID=47872 RepID=A0A1C4WQL8_9ACTN|nr:hypothetical protein [Micromonospora purpureochromogenes]SCE98443.1 hypothetical protein GA0074696_2050 [Micromonospora purpureochromogenes]
MTAPITTNIAQDGAQVGVQAQAIHGDVYYQLPPNASPEHKFRVGVRYLDARVRDRARQLIEEAAAEGYVTDEVQFHRLLALLSGRTLRQLGEDFDHLSAICDSFPHLDGGDEWRAGLRAVLRLLNSLNTAETELVIKELDELERTQRDKIVDHLGVLLDGPMEDQMWQRSAKRASAGRLAGDRAGRIWKFFHPSPVPPRVLPVEPASTPLGVWVRAVVGAAAFVLAAGKIAALLLHRGELPSILGYLACVAGLAAFAVGGVDRHFRQARRRAMESTFTPPRQRRAEAPAGGFARKVDRYFDDYFRRYVPRDTDRSHWLTQTAGIRRHLRDEVVELYREDRVGAERIAWLIRHLVSDVRQRWEQDTLMAHRVELRVPFTTTVLHLGGLAVLAAGAFWMVPAAVLTAPLAGTAWVLLAAAAAVIEARACFRIVAERRRVAADEVERARQLAARRGAFDRWQQRLSDKPSDAEMASWLECDRKILVNAAMRHYRLRPSQVIAQAFIEAPARSYQRARVPHGPWRYSRYRLLLFLLTDDGVRQVNIDLDFKDGGYRTMQRLNYRFDAVAAVRIDGPETQQQTFELTLFNGEPISVRVTESITDGVQPDEDALMLAKVSLDASGLVHTLNVLEGIAAEGKEWVRHQRQRADDRLAGLTATIKDLID